MRFFLALVLGCAPLGSYANTLVGERNQYFSYDQNDIVITDKLYQDGNRFRVYRVIHNRSGTKETCLMVGDQKFNMNPHGYGSVILTVSQYFLNAETKVLLCKYSAPENRDRCG